MTCENYMKFKVLRAYLRFYWHIATTICFHIVYGCFGALMAELSRCDRDHMACKAENTPSLACSEKVCQFLH